MFVVYIHHVLVTRLLLLYGGISSRNTVTLILRKHYCAAYFSVSPT